LWRNITSYDLSGAISDKEANEIANLAKALRRDVEEWIRKTDPKLL
jgi:HAMP domain-containing protein